MVPPVRLGLIVVGALVRDTARYASSGSAGLRFVSSLDALTAREPDAIEVTAEGPSGKVEIRVMNVPSAADPKTGIIVAGTVIRALRRVDGTTVVVGG